MFYSMDSNASELFKDKEKQLNKLKHKHKKKES